MFTKFSFLYWDGFHERYVETCTSGVSRRDGLVSNSIKPMFEKGSSYWIWQSCVPLQCGQSTWGLMVMEHEVLSALPPKSSRRNWFLQGKWREGGWLKKKCNYKSRSALLSCSFSYLLTLFLAIRFPLPRSYKSIKPFPWLTPCRMEPSGLMPHHKGSPIILILSQTNPNPRIDTNFFKVHSNTVLPTTPRLS